MLSPSIEGHFSQKVFNRDWIATVPSWPSTFEYRDMVEVGLSLSEKLRDPNGEHRCDIVIALTHSRWV